MTIPDRISHYEIDKELGNPGMSDVYLARDSFTNRQVVIKRLRERDLKNEEYQARFRQEAMFLAKFEDTPIVPIFEFDKSDGRPYIAMRYMKGGTLGEKLKGKPLPLKQIVPILDRIAEALDIAHEKKIVHRDIKPNNILFDEDG